MCPVPLALSPFKAGQCLAHCCVPCSLVPLCCVLLSPREGLQLPTCCLCPGGAGGLPDLAGPRASVQNGSQSMPLGEDCFSHHHGTDGQRICSPLLSRKITVGLAHFTGGPLDKGCQAIQGLRLATAAEAQGVCGERGDSSACILQPAKTNDNTLAGLGHRREGSRALHFEAGLYLTGCVRTSSYKEGTSTGTRSTCTRGFLELNNMASELKKQ